MWRSAVAVLLTTVLAAEVHAACPDDVQVAAFVADYRDLQVSKGFGAGLSVQDGMFLPFQPPKPGTTATLRYLGLPGDPSVSVSFK